jgi:hypothetical protein
MLSLALTVLILVGVYFLQQGHPLLAGIAAVAPVKIVATSFMTFEEGGLARLHDVLGGMLLGQVAWGVILLVVWIALK